MDNKCRAFTSLEQSRKLAEILPLESADMRIGNYVGESGKVDGTNVHYYSKGETFGAPEIICAWSLAALLEQLPEIINYEDDESDYALEISKENDLYYLSYGNPFEHGKLEVEPQENFVDACVDMIERLHELKML